MSLRSVRALQNPKNPQTSLGIRKNRKNLFNSSAHLCLLAAALLPTEPGLAFLRIGVRNSGMISFPKKRKFAVWVGILACLAGLAGCRSTTIENPHIPTIHLEASGSVPGEENPFVTLPVSETKVRVFDQPIFDPQDIIRIEIVRVERGLAVRYLLTPTASRELIRSSGDNIGYRFVFFDNSVPIGARKIDGVIEDGILYTFLEVPDEDLPELVADMNRTLVEFRRNSR